MKDYIDYSCPLPVFTLVQALSKALEPAYKDPVLRRQYAWWTVETITQHNQAELIAHATLTLNDDQRFQIEHWIRQMVDKHMPIQYLIGSVPFNELTITVKPPILIPRPETEEWTMNLIKNIQAVHATNLSILDLCSGSGCIALALGHAFPQVHVIGADIDEQALLLSRANAHHNAIKNVAFVHSDLYTHLPTYVRYDLIVSNPPYISEHAWHTLDASVTTWEARHALVADDQGLALIKRIIDGASDHLRTHELLINHQLPNLWIEIGYDQGNAVAQYMKDANIANVVIHKDLEGKDRVASGSVACGDYHVSRMKL